MVITAHQPSLARESSENITGGGTYRVYILGCIHSNCNVGTGPLKLLHCRHTVLRQVQPSHGGSPSPCLLHNGMHWQHCTWPVKAPPSHPHSTWGALPTSTTIDNCVSMHIFGVQTPKIYINMHRDTLQISMVLAQQNLTVR